MREANPCLTRGRIAEISNSRQTTSLATDTAQRHFAAHIRAEVTSLCASAKVSGTTGRGHGLRGLVPQELEAADIVGLEIHQGRLLLVPRLRGCHVLGLEGRQSSRGALPGVLGCLLRQRRRLQRRRGRGPGGGGGLRAHLRLGDRRGTLLGGRSSLVHELGKLGDLLA